MSPGLASNLVTMYTLFRSAVWISKGHAFCRLVGAGLAAVKKM